MPLNGLCSTRSCVFAAVAMLLAVSNPTSSLAATRHRHHHRKTTVSSSQHHIHRSRHTHRRHSADASHPQHTRRGAADTRSIRSGDDLVRTAIAYRGTPYVYGGAGRGGFDCSGFTSYLYERRGISLPHSARGQFEMGKHISRDALKAGDLVFFHTVTPGISHVGMYVGSGRFVHASSRRVGGVRVDSLDTGYYRSAFRGARRMR